MKLGFMNPGKSRSGIPLGIAYIVAYLEKYNDDLEIRVFDNAVGDIDAYIKEPFDMVGLSLCTASYRLGEEVARKIKQLHPGTKIVVGGPHVSSALKETLDIDVFDYAVYGEGECTVNELVNAIRDGGDLSAIDGLIYRKKDKVVINNPRAFIKDLDSIPFPAYHHFKMENYNMYCILASRGCPFDCVYCSVAAVWGRSWRKRCIDSIIEEIEFVLKHYRKNLFFFNDDTFNVELPRINEFCDKLLEKKIRIPWTCQGFRVDKVDLATVKKMSKAGCIAVGIGIESANPQMLKTIRKKITVEQVKNAMQILHKGGIYEITGLFMIGNPGDNFDTVMESIEFAKSQNFSNVAFTPALPTPSTGLMDFARERGKFIATDDCTKYFTVGSDYADYFVVYETPEFPKEERLKLAKYVVSLGFLRDPCKKAAPKADTEVDFRESLKRKLLNFKLGDFEIGYYVFRYLHKAYTLYTIASKKSHYKKVDRTIKEKIFSDS